MDLQRPSGRPPRLALPGRRGGGHPIVPEVVAEARRLLETRRLSFAAASELLGVSRTSLCRWCKRGGWVRPDVADPAGRVCPARYRRGRGRPYAADAVGAVRRLVTGTLLSQAAIARQVGVSQERVSWWIRRHGWVRPAVRPGSRRFAAGARQGPVAADGDRRGRPYAASVRMQARALWEDTWLPAALIAGRIGAHAGTVARWSRVEGWSRPRGRPGRRQLRGFFGMLKRQGS